MTYFIRSICSPSVTIIIRVVLLSVIIICIQTSSNNAHAGDNTFKAGDFTAAMDVELGAGYFDTRNTNFGVGRFDIITGENTGDAQWFEAYLKPVITAEYLIGSAGYLYGGVSLIAGLTRGDGDAGGFTNGTEDDIDNEYLYIGWNSGGLFSESLGEEAISLSFGRQDYHIGNGFLIQDGNFDQLSKGTYWLAPRTAFDNTALLKVKTQDVAADFFYLESDSDQDNTDLAGFDLRYNTSESGSIGFTYFHILDADIHFYGPRDGMDVYSIRANDINFQRLNNFLFSGEYVSQSGSGDDGKIDADAWYLQGSYTFSDASWSPTISYRYSEFSGDPDNTDNVSENFDPLFFGESTGWGTWYQGEIAGEYLLFNSNQTTHMVQLNATPNESLSVGAIYYKFDLQEKNYYGTAVSDKSFADEINIYADWTINDALYLSALYGVAFPGRGAADAFGGNEPYHLFEVAFFAYY